MAIVTTDDKHYKEIADELREGAEMVYGLSTKDMRFKPSDMSTALKFTIIDGISNSYDNGIEQGKRAEYDAFWDAFQKNGQRRSYINAFGGEGWTAETLRPTHDIIVVGAMSSIFQYCGFEGDLAQHFEDLGITFDSSGATQAHNLFSYAGKITRIPAIDISKCAAASSALFTNCYELVTIDGLTVAANNAWSGAFTSCRSLVNLTIYGTIGTQGPDLHWSKTLSRASIESVINALSATTSGLAVTFSQTAVNNAFTSDEWSALIATKQNWTISLV